MNKSISFFKKSAVALSIATTLSACGTLTGIPSHGGGKRFATEQRLVSASIRAALKDIDVSALYGKKAAIVFDLVHDEGGGSLDGGRLSLTGALSRGLLMSPGTTTSSAFQIFDLVDSNSNFSNSAFTGSNSATTTFVGTGNAATTGQNSSTGSSTSNTTGNSNSNFTNSATGSSTTNINSATNGSGTNNSTSTTAGTNSNNSTNNSTNNLAGSNSVVSTTTGTGPAVTTTAGSFTQSGGNTGTSTSNGSNNSATSNAGGYTNNSATTGSNATNSASNSTSASTNNSSNTSNNSNSAAGSNASNTASNNNSNTTQSNNSANINNQTGGNQTNRQVVSNQPASTHVNNSGYKTDGSVGLAYKGLGEYHNFNVPKSDASLLMGLVRSYLLLNGITPTTPTDQTADILLYVTVDIFGIIRQRSDFYVYNEENVKAETSFEVSAYDRKGKLIMNPTTANREARYKERYIAWAGPFATSETLHEGKGLMVDFSDIPAKTQAAAEARAVKAKAAQDKNSQDKTNQDKAKTQPTEVKPNTTTSN